MLINRVSNSKSYFLHNSQCIHNAHLWSQFEHLLIMSVSDDFIHNLYKGVSAALSRLHFIEQVLKLVLEHQRFVTIGFSHV